MNTIDSTKLIELANADYDMLKEKGKEGEKVLHYNGFLDGFARGLSESLNPWHKVSEELPEEKHYKERTLQGIREWSESESVLVIDNHYLKTVDYLKNGEWLKLRTHPKDCDGFPIQYLYWMDIPKPPKED